MTYGELSYRAKKLYTKGKITICEYLEMTKPLDREIEQEPILDKIRAEIIQSIQNGALKIESGNEELFRIIDKYRGEVDCRECKAEYECYYCKKYEENEDKE